jgi:hypothetical protein
MIKPPTGKKADSKQSKLIKSTLAELRSVICNRLRTKYELSDREISVLFSHCDLVEIYYTMPPSWLENRVRRYLDQLPERENL